jgi:hypothetical protein
MVRAILDDQLTEERDGIDTALTRRSLSPHPSLLLVLEGRTELLLMPRALAELYGASVPLTLIEPVLMGTIDRDLDLFVCHVIGLRLGAEIGDLVLLVRSPTRILVAVDPEHRFATPASQQAERVKLVPRLFEALPPAFQTPVAHSELDGLVEVTTWGTKPWEFANFTDGELARGIRSCVTLPGGITWRDVRCRVAIERMKQRPNIEIVTAPWGVTVKKTDLAKALWPRL